MTPVSSWLTSPRNSKENIRSGGNEWESGRKYYNICNFQPISRKIGPKSLLMTNRKTHVLSIGTKIIDLGWPRKLVNISSNFLGILRDFAYLGGNNGYMNEDRPTLSVEPNECMTLSFQKYKAYSDIRGVPLDGDWGIWQWGCWRRQFLAIWVATSSGTLELRPALLYGDMLPLVGL